MIVVYFSNILFFIVIGMLEGIMWHDCVNIISVRQAKLLHIPLVAIRVMWFVLAYYILDNDVASITNLILCYPFWHLGIMYWMRNKLNPSIYKHGFFDVASPTSTSILDRLLPLTFGLRLTLFIFGSIFYYLWNSL
jgi:hypothetical protein